MKTVHVLMESYLTRNTEDEVIRAQRVRAVFSDPGALARYTSRNVLVYGSHWVQGGVCQLDPDLTHKEKTDGHNTTDR